MALTLREYKGDGVRTLYPIDFDLGYLRKEYVKVYLKGGDPINELTYSWPTNNQIELSAAVSVCTSRS